MSQVKTVESEVDDMVLPYNKYIKLKEEYNPQKKISLDVVKLDDILDKANITGTWKTNYYNAFDILLKHIHRDGLFYNNDNPEACKYINYILYEEVELKNVRSYDKELISRFHDFLDAYGKKRGRQKRCISNIYNIQRETYNKINALYEVYDKYNYCSSFDYRSVKWACSDFQKFFDLYNKYMFFTESKSSKFNKILQDIEEHVKKVLSLYRNDSVCKQNSINLQRPRLFKEDTVKKPEIRNPVQRVQTELHSVDSTSQTHLSKDISTSQPEQDSERRDEGDRAQHVLSASVIHSEDDDHNEILSHRDSSQQETIDSSIRSNEEQSQTYSSFQIPIRHSYPPGTSLYSRHDGHIQHQAFSKEVEMPPSSFMNTITSTLKNVDPVPVVGVSGGMGALFLLFRYTPVGAFFRGGRRRAHTIPRSFNGQFLGGFPGYEDYEVGHIGYGPMSMNPLAE